MAFFDNQVGCSISYREKLCVADMSEVAQVHVVLQKSSVSETIQPTAMKTHSFYLLAHLEKWYMVSGATIVL
jgi:hypothetical protein